MTALNYEKLIPRIERENLEEILQMDSGYVLDFSDRTFSDFFFEKLGIDTDESGGLFSGRGTSKAKRLRSFIENAEPQSVAKLLRELWEFRITRVNLQSRVPSEKSREMYFQTVSRLEGHSDEIDATAIQIFEPNETLEELVASIKRDLDANKPQAGLDRLHTYCMKRFASLIRKHGGGDCGKDDPLHSRVGRYVQILKTQKNLTTMSETIIRSSISVFERLNPVRNDRSFAHDNAELVNSHEARFIFDSVTAFLRFSKSIDGQSFED